MRTHRSPNFWNAISVAVLLAIVAAAAGVARPNGIADAIHTAALDVAGSAGARATARQRADIAALEQFRPGYPFWRHVFTIPDGSIVFGSARDGRKLAVLRSSSDSERESVAARLEAASGPVLHNPTRGTFAAPGLAEYGSLLGEWGAIYERFGVPRSIGLAQALIESGFIGTRRSEADAVGLCQWLEANWKVLDRLDPAVLEIENQTTQAAYCAAYLSILATKYDSFIPALSEHHAGGTNIGRVLVNGERLGGKDARDQYFRGAGLAVTLRNAAASGEYRDIYGSYGPRSFRYAEMIFGNAGTVEDRIAGTTQQRIHAMRTARAIALDEIAQRTGLSDADIRRYNPALARQVPAGATLYLPARDAAFGDDVSFWHRDAPESYRALLEQFMALDVTPERWDSPSFAATMKDFERRFRSTATPEGTVMATMLAYVRGEAVGPRRRILATYRSSDAIRDLFQQGVREAEHTAE